MSLNWAGLNLGKTGGFYIVNLINEYVMVTINIVNLLIYHVFHCSNLITTNLQNSNLKKSKERLTRNFTLFFPKK